tara:strand:- start:22321 stop:22503 length:183 start_codon:yes stop_codon:yes gene_type:complete
MLNKKRKSTTDICNHEKRCKFDKKRKNNLELVSELVKKYKIYHKSYILTDINLMILYGLL